MSDRLMMRQQQAMRGLPYGLQRPADSAHPRALGSILASGRGNCTRLNNPIQHALAAFLPPVLHPQVPRRHAGRGYVAGL